MNSGPRFRLYVVRWIGTCDQFREQRTFFERSISWTGFFLETKADFFWRENEWKHKHKRPALWCTIFNIAKVAKWNRKKWQHECILRRDRNLTLHIISSWWWASFSFRSFMVFATLPSSIDGVVPPPSKMCIYSAVHQFVFLCGCYNRMYICFRSLHATIRDSPAWGVPSAARATFILSIILELDSLFLHDWRFRWGVTFCIRAATVLLPFACVLLTLCLCVCRCGCAMYSASWGFINLKPGSSWAFRLKKRKKYTFYKR
jgi:hypothetical protein